MDSYMGYISSCEKLKLALNEGSSQNLHAILNELNSFKYPGPISQRHTEEAIKSVVQWDTPEEAIICKVELWLKNLLSRQKIVLEPSLLRSTLKWVTKLIPRLPVESLNLLAAIFRSTRPIERQIVIDIFSLNLMKFLVKGRLDSRTIAVITFVDSVCSEILQWEDKMLLKEVLEIAEFGLLLLQAGEVEIDFAFLVLNISRHIVFHHPEWAEDGKRLSLLVGCFKAFLSDDFHVPTPVQPTQQPLPDEGSTTREGFKVLKAGQKKPRINGLRPNPPMAVAEISDSDFSEREDREQYLVYRRFKLRHSAVNMILTLAQTIDKKLLFGYFHTFFNDLSTASLLSVMDNDASPKCRATALQAAAYLIFNFRPYLLQAELTCSGGGSFTPFIVALGNTMVLIYAQLEKLLGREQNVNVIVQTLKSTGNLVGATSFSRCKTQVLRGLVKEVLGVLPHRDLTIKVAALNVIESIFVAEGITEDVLKEIGLSSSEATDEEEEFEVDVQPETSNKTSETFNDELFPVVFEHLGALTLNPTTNSQLRIKCLQILQASGIFIKLYVHHLASMATSIRLALETNQDDVQLHAAKALDTIAGQLNKLIIQAEARNLLDTYYKFWSEVEQAVVNGIQNVGNHRSTLVDALVSYECLYDRLGRNKQLFLIAFLNGLASDENELVRGSALRTLAIFVQFPALKEDICFIENTIEAIINALEKHVYVLSLKASWSLANVTDVFVEKGCIPINPTLLRNVFQICCECGTGKKEKENVKTNIVRCLGGLLRLVEDTSIVPLVTESVNVMCHNLASNDLMKLKWNAAYAASLFLKNEKLFGLGLHPKVFRTLCLEAKKSSNFKVKTSAVTALGAVRMRDQYGTHFGEIFLALMTVLLESNNLADYNEYKHKEYLQEETCIVLSHLISLVQTPDLQNLADFVGPVEDVLRPIWMRSINRMLPEKAEKIYGVLRVLGDLKVATAEQRSALESLKGVFFIREPI